MKQIVIMAGAVVLSGAVVFVAVNMQQMNTEYPSPVALLDREEMAETPKATETVVPHIDAVSDEAHVEEVVQPLSSPSAVSRPAQRPIPTSMVTVMGEAAEKNYFVRLKAVEALGKNLSSDEKSALYLLLYRKKGEDVLRLAELNGLKNEVLNVLRSQNDFPEELVVHLVGMFNDRSYDVVWRDYCVQHLGGSYGLTQKAEQKQIIADLFLQATDDKKVSIAGTALIAMDNNVESGIDRKVLTTKALELVNDKECGELTLMTALQVCANLGDRGVLPVARSIAISNRSVPLRMSAIAAVGTAGDASDKEMLERYASSADVRLRKSAQSALKRLGKAK